MKTPRALCASVDVDPLRLYRAIHGIAPAAAASEGPDPVWTRGVPRFLELFEELGIRATFFVVASDLDAPEVADTLRELHARGHEVANHTLTHPYDLVRAPLATIRRELEEADRRLREAVGAPVRGYRAPGYNQTPVVRAELARLGYLYDASGFPCPPYVAAKSLIIAAKRIRGRVSRSIVARPWDAFGPRTPHRVEAGERTLWSLPISVLPFARFPLIGTSLTLLGARGVAALSPLVRRMPYLSLEFHAVDLMGLEEDGLPADLAVQPDLRVPIARKRDAFVSLLRRAVSERPALTNGQLARRLDADDA